MKNVTPSWILGLLIFCVSWSSHALEQRVVSLCGDLSRVEARVHLDIGGSRIAVTGENTELANALLSTAAGGAVPVCVSADRVPMATSSGPEITVFAFRLSQPGAPDVSPMKGAVRICGAIEAIAIESEPMEKRVRVRFFEAREDAVELTDEEGQTRVDLDSWSRQDGHRVCALGSRLPEIREGRLVFEVDRIRSLLQRTGFSVGSRYEIEFRRPGASPGLTPLPGMPSITDDLRR